MFPIKRWQFAVLPMALAIAGCGDSVTKVSGRVTIDGQQFAPVGGRTMKVFLSPLDAPPGAKLSPEQKAALIATVNPDGEFDLPAVPPGRYAVAASDFERFPSVDRLAAHFREHPREIIWEIPGDEPSRTLALEKGWIQQPPRRR